MPTPWSQMWVQQTGRLEHWGWLCPEELPTRVTQKPAPWQHHLPQLWQKTTLVCRTQAPCQCLEAMMVTNLPQWET